MAPQLTKFNISMSLVEPGPVSTPFIENIHKNAGAAENSAPKEPSDPYAWVLLLHSPYHTAKQSHCSCSTFYTLHPSTFSETYVDGAVAHSDIAQLAGGQAPHKSSRVSD